MFKSFIIGSILTALIILASNVLNDNNIFVYGTQILGLGGLILAALLSGLMSDNIHRRTYVEKKDERDYRLDRSLKIVLFSVPSLIALLVYYIL